MQTNIAKQYSILFKVFLGVLFLLIVGAAQTTTIKKSLVYDDTSTEFVTDLDIDAEGDDNGILKSLALLPSSYTVLHETTEVCKRTTFSIQQGLSEGGEAKLYILFHQLKLHIA